jgi:hypothetical protein
MLATAIISRQIWCRYGRFSSNYGIIIETSVLEGNMKLICKCGNVEELKTDKLIEKFDFKSCDNASIIAVCKNCKEVVFIKLKNS